MKDINNQKLSNPKILYLLNDIQYYVKSYGWQRQEQNRNQFTLFIIMDGTGKLLLNGEFVHLTEGKCIVIPANMAMQISAGKEGICFYQLIFHTINLEESVHFHIHQIFSTIREIRCHPLSQCANHLEAIYRNRLTHDELSDFELHVRFQEFILFILQQNLPDFQPKDDRQAVEQSIKYIHEHYEKDWTVEQLADLVDVPRWNYSRLFKEITGQIPLHYLNDIRIERAKQLLITTNDRVFEVGQTVGFSNEYYFSRRFKEHVGISPGQYRRNRSGNARVFAPFLEDFLVALGVTPIAQFSHSKWGKQEYLELHEIPEIDLETGQIEQLFKYKPNLIRLDTGINRWENYHRLDQLAPICHFSHPGEDWRSTLYKIADLIGKTDIVNDIILQYEQKAQEAKEILNQSVYGQTVVFLRISAKGISIYAGPECGYTGPILYRDLGLMPHPLVWQIPQYTRKSLLTQDQLKQLDANHIFITFDKQHSAFEGEERKILTSSLWQELPAAQNHCVYEVDFLTWMNYGVLSHSKKIVDVLHVLG